MFNFLALHTRDWGIWHRIDIPDLSKRILVIVGPNNSGKTTIADAQLTLLGSEKLFGERTVAFYVRDPSGGKRKRVSLIMAHVSNYAGTRNRRPFYQAGIKTDEATIAVAIEIRDGQANRTFFIGPGRLSVAELAQIYAEKHERSERGEWMGLRDWQKRVMGPAQAGPKQLDQLAVDAAEVNAIVGRRDHALYESIAKRLFDTETLNNYETSLRSLEEAKQAAVGTLKTLRQQEGELAGLERQKTILVDWQSSDARIEDAEKTLTAAKYAEALVTRDAKHRTSERFATELNLVKEARRAALEKVRRAEDDRKGLLKNQETASKNVSLAKERRAKAEKAFHEAYKENVRREQAESELANCPKTPLAKAQEAYRAAFEVHRAAAAEHRDVQESAKKAKDRVRQLEAGRVPLPLEVQATHDELRDAGIRFQSLGELVDLDLQSAPLFEAALAHLRFTITVDPKDGEPAQTIARQNGFPGPIYSQAATSTTSAKSGKYRTGTPTPIAMILDASTRAKDALSTPFGTFVTPINASELFLARKALSQILEAANRELATIARKLETSEQQEKTSRASLERADKEQRGASRALELSEILGETKDATKILKQADTDAEAARAEFQTAEDEAKRVDRDLAALNADARIHDGRLSDADKAVTEAQERVKNATADLEQAESQLAEMEGLVDSLVRTKIKQDAGEFTPIKHAERELRLAKEQRARLPPRPDPGVDKLYERQFATVKQTQASLEEREGMRKTAEKQTAEKRTHYLMASNDLFRGYERRLKEMGELANMTILADCPRFTMESTDEEIRNAKIEVRIGYGKTAPRWHGDVAFSQGQKYLNSLILILGLAETGQESFFILDEPTQNLSSDRIPVLFNFMQSTKAQYFLAIPTSLDPEMYKGVGHLVALTRPDENTGYAPAPAIIEV